MPEHGEGEGSIFVERKPAILRTIYSVHINYFTYRGSSPALPTPESGIPYQEQRAVLPWLSSAEPWPAIDPSKPRPLQVDGESRIVHTVGWPYRALYCTYKWTNTSEGYLIKTQNGLELGWRRRWGTDRYVLALPVRPVWRGLLFDIALFASVGWSSVFGSRSLRRHMRRRRGLCPACAYDLRADFPSGCPECGWGRNESVVPVPGQPTNPPA